MSPRGTVVPVGRGTEQAAGTVDTLMSLVTSRSLVHDDGDPELAAQIGNVLARRY